MKLTNAGLKKMLERPGRHGDGGGLYFRTLGGDKAYWVFRYRANNREREISVGAYPEISLADARAKHMELRRRVIIDKADPLAEKCAAKQITALAMKVHKPTFGEIADEVIALKQRDLRNVRSSAQWAMTLREYAGPLRMKPVADITTKDVLAVIGPLWDRVPETASRLRGRIERVIDQARAHGHIPPDVANPARLHGHLELLLGARRTLTRGLHAAMAYGDVPAFVQWLRGKPGVSARALEFTVLTAARTGEVIGARKCEIDIDAAVWTIPGARMKAARDHRVPLSAPALAIAEEAMSSQGEYLFPNIKGKPLSNMAMANTLKSRDSTVTVHGCRASFKSWAEDRTDHAREVIEAALAHRIGDKSEQAYRRSDQLDKRRKLMDAWAAFCEHPGGEVVPLRRARPA